MVLLDISLLIKAQNKEGPMNNVVLIGRLTRDPETRYSGEGLAITRFSLAIDRPVKSSSGEKQTDFPNIVVFGKQAENCEKYLAKGRMAAVQGRIQTGSYTNKEGVKVYTTEVIAERIQFLEWGDSNNKSGDSGSKPSSDSLPGGFESYDDGDLPF